MANLLNNRPDGKAPTGFELWRGESLIDGGPVVVIATVKSGNRKTGNMLQTWIIRADMKPLEASRTGADSAICGDCSLKGLANLEKESGWADERGCYVNLLGVQSIFNSWKRGIYPGAYDPESLAGLGEGRVVRLGAYGDPAAVPSHVWESLISRATGWTGYTHQRGIESADTRAGLFMASAETLEQAESAWESGWRTFRTLRAPHEIDSVHEVMCPATPEGGLRATCATCKLCAGNSKRGKSVAIVVHGNGAKHAARAIDTGVAA